jgi:hypothetical protein
VCPHRTTESVIVQSEEKTFARQRLGKHLSTANSHATIDELLDAPICSESTVGDSPRWCLYFDVVVGPAGSNDPDSYAGGSIATGRVTQAGQVEGDDPD